MLGLGDTVERSNSDSCPSSSVPCMARNRSTSCPCASFPSGVMSSNVRRHGRAQTNSNEKSPFSTPHGDGAQRAAFHRASEVLLADSRQDGVGKHPQINRPHQNSKRTPALKLWAVKLSRPTTVS
jgi:hypothetical protein